MGADLYIVERLKQPDVVAAREKWNRAIQHRDELLYMVDVDYRDITEAQELVNNLYDANAMYPPDGYFRDSYNETSLFWVLGLSWWTDVGDLMDRRNPIVDEETGTRLNESLYESEEIEDHWDLDSEGIQELRDMVAEKDIHVSDVRWDVLVGTKEEWIQSWQEKKSRFLEMCDNAIANNWHMSLSI